MSRPRAGGAAALLAQASLLALAVTGDAACRAPIPPYAEALVIVDTDLPARLAGNLRVDLYAADGTWYESRVQPTEDASAWPASFGVYSTDESGDTQILMRLRIYPLGPFDQYLRDYHGEQYANQNGPLPNAAGPTDVGPRLIVDGKDATPSREPQPLVTIDRLVLLRLQPGVVGSARVLLTAECAGTMALLSQTPPYQTPTIGQASSCIDHENVLSIVTETPLDPDTSIPTTTALGTFAAQPCEGSAPAASRAECVPGGVYVLGDPTLVDLGPPYDGVPVRIVAMSRFWMDRNEVTVGEVRAAIDAGFHRGLSLPQAHDGPLGTPLATDVYRPLDEWCSWSTHPMGREDDPISCIDWSFARDYCVYVGGTLTTEARFEYAGAAASRPYKTYFPWGDAPLLPSCTQVAYDRYNFENLPFACGKLGAGPQAVGTTPYDVTPGGIFDLAGSQTELMLDELADYGSPCWLATLHDPSCLYAGAVSASPVHAMRGGGWAFIPSFLYQTVRNDSGLATARSAYGFRCTFASAPP